MKGLTFLWEEKYNNLVITTCIYITLSTQRIPKTFKHLISWCIKYKPHAALLCDEKVAKYKLKERRGTTLARCLFSCPALEIFCISLHAWILHGFAGKTRSGKTYAICMVQQARLCKPLVSECISALELMLSSTTEPGGAGDIGSKAACLLGEQCFYV